MKSFITIFALSILLISLLGCSGAERITSIDIVLYDYYQEGTIPSSQMVEIEVIKEENIGWFSTTHSRADARVSYNNITLQPSYTRPFRIEADTLLFDSEELFNVFVTWEGRSHSLTNYPCPKPLVESLLDTMSLHGEFQLLNTCDYDYWDISIEIYQLGTENLLYSNNVHENYFRWDLDEEFDGESFDLAITIEAKQYLEYAQEPFESISQITVIEREIYIRNDYFP